MGPACFLHSRYSIQKFKITFGFSDFFSFIRVEVDISYAIFLRFLFKTVEFYAIFACISKALMIKI